MLRKVGRNLSASDVIVAAVRTEEQVPVYHGDGGAGLVVTRIAHFGHVQHIAIFCVDDIHRSGVVLNIQFSICTGW